MKVMIELKKRLMPSALYFSISTMLLITGCGGGETAPNGSTITMDPSTVTASIAGIKTCFQWRVIVRYSGGQPMSQANVTINGAFAAPNVSPSYQFFLEPNCDDPGAANHPVNSGFTVQTDSTGVYTFSTLVSASTPTFKDTIHVYSGIVSGSADFTIN